MTETLAKCSSRKISYTYHIYDHIYIGYSDGSLVQMDLNGKILYAGQTNLGYIDTIFHFKRVLIVCGESKSYWDITYPLTKGPIKYNCRFTRSATFDDISIYATDGMILSVGSVDISSETLFDKNHIVTKYTSFLLCINEDSIIFVNTKGIFKTDHNFENPRSVYERTRGDNITISDGKGKVDIKVGHVRSICTWRDSIVTSLSMGNDAGKTIRWKCGSMDTYEPELFLKRGPESMKIMDDQLFEFGIAINYTVNCWSWNKVHLMKFSFLSGFDGKGLKHSLLINSNIYVFNYDATIIKKTGIFSSNLCLTRAVSKWSPKTHSDFTITIREMAKTLFMMNRLEKCIVRSLPRDILCFVIQLTAT